MIWASSGASYHVLSDGFGFHHCKRGKEKQVQQLVCWTVLVLLNQRIMRIPSLCQVTGQSYTPLGPGGVSGKGIVEVLYSRAQQTSEVAELPTEALCDCRASAAATSLLSSAVKLASNLVELCAYGVEIVAVRRDV